MDKTFRLLLPLFLFWLCFELYVETIQWDYPLLYLLAKGGIVPLLFPFAYSIRKWSKPVFTWLTIGMVFCWIGDLLLIKGEEQLWFMSGLGSFLLGQVSYTVAFAKSMEDNFEVNLIKKLPLIPLILVVIVGFTFRILMPHLEEMLVPVFLYTAAITLMVMMAIGRFKKTPLTSFYVVLLGALFFLSSDTMIAFNKFVAPIPAERSLIMATYGLGQLGIVWGLSLGKWED